MTKVLKRAFILAAGKGTRLGEITKTTPKPLVSVAGQPVLMRLLQTLENAGVQEVVINLHYLGEQIEQAIGIAQLSGYFPRLTIHFSYELELLETGGGLKHALPMLGDGPFYVINSDCVWLEDQYPMLEDLAANFDPSFMKTLLAVVPTGIAKGFRKTGDFDLSPAGSLRFSVQKEFAPYIYCGVHVATADVVKDWSEKAFSLAAPWKQMAKEGQLQGWVYRGPWVDMGTPEGLDVAKQLLATEGLARTA
jgi:MurNAc alpha-1-phosphate uridylyltransferase